MHSFVGGHFTTDYKRRRAEVLRADGSRSHIRSCTQKSPILERNSRPPTVSESASRRVKTYTSAEVTTVPKIRQETALRIERAWLSRNIVRPAEGPERAPLLEQRPEPLDGVLVAHGLRELQVEGQIGGQSVAQPHRHDPVGGRRRADLVEVPAGELLGGDQQDDGGVEQGGR